MKKIFTLILVLMSFSCYANCEKAPATSSPAFCAKFKSIASCHCQADGHLPAGLCSDVGTIYNRMITTFGSQQKGCDWAASKGSPIRPDSSQQCMKDWDCYRLGTGECYAKCM